MNWKEVLTMLAIGLLASLILTAVYPTETQARNEALTAPRPVTFSQDSTIPPETPASSPVATATGQRPATSSSQATVALPPPTVPPGEAQHAVKAGEVQPAVEAIAKQRIAERRIAEIETAYQADLEASQQRIANLESTLAELRKQLETQGHAAAAARKPESLDPSPSRRYASQINRALNNAESYLRQETYQTERSQALLAEIIELYKIQGLSGSQNDNLKICFRGLLQQKIDHLAMQLEALTVDQARTELTELQEINQLRFKRGNRTVPWLMRKQVAMIRAIEARFADKLEQERGAVGRPVLPGSHPQMQ
ncbi:MAG: hypothetical protein AAF657_04770 [Acidobacteriota bacterium]